MPAAFCAIRVGRITNQPSCECQLAMKSAQVVRPALLSAEQILVGTYKLQERSRADNVHQRRDEKPWIVIRNLRWGRASLAYLSFVTDVASLERDELARIDVGFTNQWDSDSKCWLEWGLAYDGSTLFH
jgi:hypothetical protein